LLGNRVFDPPEDNPVQKFSRSLVPTGKKVKDQVFAFDRIFDDKVSQVEVYEGTTKPLLDSVMDGYNATVFAYGATGCGKTHTITGTPGDPGIIFMTMQELFEKINERADEKVTELSLSYLEIYNETIRDLLVQGGSKQGLNLREDSNQGVSVPGLTMHHPKDVNEVMDMIVKGNEYRTVSPTEANAVSSRSHAVLQINIAMKDRNADVNEPHTLATLSIIDLAGSERASATKNRGERLIEGANINKSLLALGSCINALCDPRKKNHVPYRNSKLTRLLKFSLGGNCKTVMIVCVSPSSAHFDETQNTLRYANRAKNIQTKVTRNVFNVNRHVKDFLVKIDEQMAMINELKAQQRDAETIFAGKLRKQAEKREAATREGVARLRAAYDNTATERADKVANMKRLRSFERRIGLLASWIASFDVICDRRGEGSGNSSGEDSMPPSLSAMRKTAHGILAELEHSRQHMHQKLERTNWERGLDTALQHTLTMVAAGAGTGAVATADSIGSEQQSDTLCREVELLKASFALEANREVMEHDRAGDAAVVQVLLTAQFDMLSSLALTLTMSEDEAVSHAKTIINRLLDVGLEAAQYVIKPDGSAVMAISAAERFPPTKRGTPKRKKSLSGQPRAAPMASVYQQSTISTAGTFAADTASASPIKIKNNNSPRRMRKAGPARRVGAGGVSFTPVKAAKRSPAAARRGVRWRDDETEEGTLADFEKTPQRTAEWTPEQKRSTSPEKSTVSQPTVAVSPAPSRLSHVESAATDDKEQEKLQAEAEMDADTSSPSLVLPDVSTLHVAKPNRFQAGFLAKSRDPGSPVGPTLSLHLRASASPSSDSESRSTPLRSIPVSRAANALSPSGQGPRYLSPKSSFSSSTGSSGAFSNLSTFSTLSTLDENNPPSRTAGGNNTASASSGSDSECSTIDPTKLRSALHSAKRRDRLSSMSGTAASNAKRHSSIGGSSFPLAALSTHHRASSSYSGPPLASSTNGISRHRRGSAERRRSPPISCSPVGDDYLSFQGAVASNRAFTAGQARRMNLGGSVRLESSASPDRRMGPDSRVRRITIGSAAMAGAGAASGSGVQGSVRPSGARASVAWR
jgi:kinesin family protein 18/19